VEAVDQGHVLEIRARRVEIPAQPFERAPRLQFERRDVIAFARCAVDDHAGDVQHVADAAHRRVPPFVVVLLRARVRQDDLSARRG
jgi:hypothetical protein